MRFLKFLFVVTCNAVVVFLLKKFNLIEDYTYTFMLFMIFEAMHSLYAIEEKLDL